MGTIAHERRHGGLWCMLKCLGTPIGLPFGQTAEGSLVHLQLCPALAYTLTTVDVLLPGAR
jgi:hypothetical protein